MLQEGATISRRRTWLLRMVGVSISAWALFQLMQALQSTHFELGASRRHFVFDLQYGRIHYAAGIVMLCAAVALGIALVLLEVFDSERGRRRYRTVCTVIGCFAMAAIACGYLAQIWRF